MIFMLYYNYHINNVVGALLSCISGTAALTFQFGQITLYENSQDQTTPTPIGQGGVQFNNAWESGIAISWIVQIFSIIAMYMTIAYALRDKKRRTSANFQTNISEHENVHDSRDMFEALPNHATVAVCVQGLTKTYTNTNFFSKKSETVTAVDTLNMSILKGEVFGFLGHNGAGKTTTVSILAAETGYDGGNVAFTFPDGTKITLGDGEDEKIINRIGVCPQRDFLFDGFTCREHLQWFARLKGNVPVSGEQTHLEAIDTHVQSLISALQFTSEDDENRRVRDYSGGMKRKVSLGISLLGNPQMLFLDEPTAGMDPYNRRKVWDLIIGMKTGKSIVLTTHFMDEADALSDRIGVIKAGKMVTCGSSLFLKHAFGAGYSFAFEAPADSDPNSEMKSGYDSVKVEAEDYKDRLVKNIIPDAKLKYSELVVEDGHTKAVSHWQIPYGSENAISELLETIEENEGYEVRSLENTTLEQVFLKTGTENVKSHEDGIRDCTVDFNVENLDSDILQAFWSGESLERNGSWLSKALAISTLVFVSAWPALILVYFVVFPIVFVVVGFIFPKFIDPVENVELSLVWCICVLFIGIAAGPFTAVLQNLGELQERDFFSVIRLLGVPVKQSYIGVVLSIGFCVVPVTYILTMIMSAAFGYNLTGSFDSWLLVTLAFVLLLLSWAPYLGIIGTFTRTKVLGSLASSLSSTVCSIIFVVFFLVGMFASKETVEILIYVFSVIPFSAFQIAVYEISVGGDLYNSTTGSVGTDASFSDLLSWNSFILYPLIMLIVMGIIGWYILLFILRSRDICTSAGDVQDKQFVEPDVRDLDTAARQGTAALSAVRLRKSYTLKKKKITKHVVKGVSIPVNDNKIFALLGPNGAGKTQIMKMLTGNVIPDSGKISFGVGMVMNEFFAAGKCGYVPQTNALWDMATVKQHLNFACRVRGINASSPECISHVDSIACVLCLKQHMNKKVKELSGGYKRKLSLAIACVGTPSVLLLDEVTTGMDPGARHDIWSILRPQEKVHLPAILLSTHYLDEAEFLANTIGILNGDMIATGTLQKLSDKYGKFNQVQVNFGPLSNVDDAQKTVMAALPEGSHVSEQVLNRIVVKVPRKYSESLRKELGRLFTTMEGLKRSKVVDIAYYSVAKVSLEQIFMELCAHEFQDECDSE
eukprot:CFRG1407T1